MSHTPPFKPLIARASMAGGPGYADLAMHRPRDRKVIDLNWEPKTITISGELQGGIVLVKSWRRRIRDHARWLIHCHRPQGGDDNTDVDWATIGAVIGGALVLWLVIEAVKAPRYSLYTPQFAPQVNEDGTSQIKAYWKLRF